MAADDNQPGPPHENDAQDLKPTARVEASSATFSDQAISGGAGSLSGEVQQRSMDTALPNAPDTTEDTIASTDAIISAGTDTPQHTGDASLEQLPPAQRDLYRQIFIAYIRSSNFHPSEEQLQRIGFVPHEVPDEEESNLVHRFFLRQVEQGNMGSGGQTAFGGPFSREEAEEEFRPEMIRRLI